MLMRGRFGPAGLLRDVWAERIWSPYAGAPSAGAWAGARVRPVYARGQRHIRQAARDDEAVL
eukprot:3125965-Rhodomonas_salina.3